LEYGKCTHFTFWNFPLYYKTLLHSEAFTELHVYSCKRMYIASALFYCNSNRISHTSHCVSLFSALDVGQILIIHKKKTRKKLIFFNTTIIYWEYQLFVNKKMSHILLLFYFHEKTQVTVTIGSVHRLLYIMSPTNNMKNMHVNDFRKKMLFT
jgi:hypothetical protein